MKNSKSNFWSILVWIGVTTHANALTICINHINIRYNSADWISKQKGKLIKRKTNWSIERYSIQKTDQENPNIRKPEKEEIDRYGALPDTWYLGGVPSSSAAPAVETKIGKIKIYETANTCSMTYKNGLTGSALCYNARIIGLRSDIEITAGPVPFEENKSSMRIDTKEFNKFRTLTRSATESECQGQ